MSRSIRWCTCPIVQVGDGRWPKVNEVADPGQSARPLIDDRGVVRNNMLTFPKHRGAKAIPLADLATVYPGVPFTVNGDELHFGEVVDFRWVGIDVPIFDSNDVQLTWQPTVDFTATYGPDFCLVQCIAHDLSEVEKDAEIDETLEEKYDHAQHPTFLDLTPVDQAWDVAKMTRVGNALQTKRGEQHADIKNTTPLWRLLQVVGEKFNPNFDPRKQRITYKD